MKKFIIIQFSLIIIIALSVGGKINAQTSVAPANDKTQPSAAAPACIEVITPAISPEGICKNFPTPCDVPTGWKNVEKCPTETITPIETPSPTKEEPTKEEKAVWEEKTTEPNKESTKEPTKEPTKESTKEVPKPSSQIPVPLNVCAVSDEYIKEINELIKEADLAKSRGDVETEKKITEKIKLIKEKIEAKKKECQNQNQPTPSQPPQQQNVATNTTSEFCQLEKQIVTKIEYYKSLLSLSPEELKDKGYDKKEIGRILGELQNERAKVHSACSGEKVGWKISEIKPVAPQKAEEVATYYKEKVAQTMEQSLPTATQLKEIKQIKEEAKTMVKELIRSQNEISAQEIQPIVEKFKIKPGAIEISDEQLKVSKQKKIEAMVADNPVEIEVNPQKLIIKDRKFEGKEVEIETQLPLNLTAEGGLVGETGAEGGKEIKVAPSQILEKSIVKNPVDLKIELTQEKETPVYKIKAVEKRKLFFFIPVNVNKEITVDASSEKATKLKETKPWWSFLAF
jgi:hypothetical protein